jgi:hypothetical protein
MDTYNVMMELTTKSAIATATTYVGNLVALLKRIVIRRHYVKDLVEKKILTLFLKSQRTILQTQWQRNQQEKYLRSQPNSWWSFECWIEDVTTNALKNINTSLWEKGLPVVVQYL